MSDDFEEAVGRERFAGAGGTRGGIVEFFVGLGLVVVGGFLVMRRVTVYSGYWGWFGGSTFGVKLIPLLLGIGVLFFNGKSILGWLLTAGGLAIIFAGILLNLDIRFQPTDLFTTLVMFAMMAAGVGLVARAIREH